MQVTKGQNVIIGAKVKIGDGTIIGHNVIIHDDSIIGSDVRIDDNAVIGKLPMKAKASATTVDQEFPPVEIGDGSLIGTGAIVYRGAKLAKNVLIADLASVRENMYIPCCGVTVVGELGLLFRERYKICSADQVHRSAPIKSARIEEYVGSQGMFFS